MVGEAPSVIIRRGHWIAAPKVTGPPVRGSKRDVHLTSTQVASYGRSRREVRGLRPREPLHQPTHLQPYDPHAARLASRRTEATRATPPVG